MNSKLDGLVEKFYYSLPNNGSQTGLNSTTRRMEEAKMCAKIAEGFALGFVAWLKKNDVPENAERFFHYTNVEMLEKYKQENY